jgi:hypothetical protein
VTNVRVDVARVAPCKLRRQVWSFWLNDRLQLILDGYSEQERTTARHKWLVSRSYTRLSPRHSIPESAAPLPDDVAADALQQVCETLTVRRWSEVAGR